MSEETSGGVNRCWLYKDGKGEIFEGDGIAVAMAEGWADSPDPNNATPPPPDEPLLEDPPVDPAEG